VIKEALFIKIEGFKKNNIMVKVKKDIIKACTLLKFKTLKLT